ncbi:hypothetical protein GCM10011509_22220 [Ornithinimicrobium pekingense]|uniref:Uncharacterized protein n=1 Tax=Ornithinimicrobium pekingense TaxID=384677 RepID=A0ABQ2F988_9MICO|nr:hypothetical protein GCM10011509_22220 [Ornithinimicrobium pekingense]
MPARRRVQPASSGETLRSLTMEKYAVAPRLLGNPNRHGRAAGAAAATVGTVGVDPEVCSWR